MYFLRICSKYYIKILKTERMNRSRESLTEGAPRDLNSDWRKGNSSEAANKEVREKMDNLVVVMTESRRNLCASFFPLKK